MFRAAYQQVVWLLVNLLLPGDGTTVRLSMVAAACFWPTVAVLMALRYRKWTKTDSRLVLYGFWPILVATFVIAVLLGKA